MEFITGLAVLVRSPIGDNGNTIKKASTLKELNRQQLFAAKRQGFC